MKATVVQVTWEAHRLLQKILDNTIELFARFEATEKIWQIFPRKNYSSSLLLLFLECSKEYMSWPDWPNKFLLELLQVHCEIGMTMILDYKTQD